MLALRLLHANRGDCMIIEFGDNTDPHYIIIDGGIGVSCVRELKLFLENIQKNGQIVDLIVLTHYDEDHIQGFLKLMEHNIINSNLVKAVWMNYGNELSKIVSSDSTLCFSIAEASCDTSASQGKEFYEYLYENNIKVCSTVLAGNTYIVGGARINILSPSINQIKKMLEKLVKHDGDIICPYESKQDKETAGSGDDYHLSMDQVLSKRFIEDKSVTNCSSIAFLFSYNGYRLLLLGDSVPSQIINSLTQLGYSRENKLKLDYCKLSHHGSNYNTSNLFLELIDCRDYIISSNWNCERPGKECLSRVAFNNKTKTVFYCNYKNKDIFSANDMKKYGISFKCVGEQRIILEE